MLVLFQVALPGNGAIEVDFHIQIHSERVEGVTVLGYVRHQVGFAAKLFTRTHF